MACAGRTQSDTVVVLILIQYKTRVPDERVIWSLVFAVYEEHVAADFPGQYDYSCRYSHGSNACTISVFDRQEAEFLCDVEPQCTAFVLTAITTWTGKSRTRGHMDG
jgi:hypothetical protein